MDAKTPRGRPRNATSRSRVLEAARTLLSEGGIAAVTIEELSARTGVGRPTIYRSWPNARAVAMAALMATAVPSQPKSGPSSARTELTLLISELVAAFITPTGRSAALLIAAADQGTELSKAFRHHLILKCRDQLLAILCAAIAAGEISEKTDPELAADLIMAPVFFRLLVGHQPLDAGLAAAIVEQVFGGLTD